MFDPNHNASPFNAIPFVVLLLVIVIGGIEIVFQLASMGYIGGNSGVGWRSVAVFQFGFLDANFEWMRTNRLYPINAMMTFVTYSFVHVEAMHAGFACVLLLAIGKFVAERFSAISVLIIFFAGSIFGALGYGLILNEHRQLLGAYPAVYALIGALTFILFTEYDKTGQNRLKAFRLIGVLVGLQLVFRVIGAGGNDWVADICGFVAGFLLSFVLAPDGKVRIQRWIAQSRNR